MFGLFGKKTPKLTISPADKDWIESNVIWFLEAYGLDKIREHPFLIPPKDFPYNNLTDKKQFEALFLQLCELMAVSPDDIQVKFFDDLVSKEWTTPLTTSGAFDQPAGVFEQVYIVGEKRYTIHLAKSALADIELVIAVIARQLAQAKLIMGYIVKSNDPHMENLAEVVIICSGFGICVANTYLSQNAYWTRRNGFLTDKYVSYANALLCYITQTEAGSITKYLNTNTNALFQQHYEYLISTNDTLLTIEKVKDTQYWHNASKSITEGFKNRSFGQVIEACHLLLNKYPPNTGLYNNLGYALLMQKNYGEAIAAFTKAVDLDPYWDFPYNNRGYCKLQSGEIENSFADLHSSFEMNPTNSFSWRNLGVYYLMTGEAEKALQHFEEAQKIDPTTELINFYLSKVHLKLDNEEKAKQYLKRSIAANEYNDSVLE